MMKLNLLFLGCFALLFSVSCNNKGGQSKQNRDKSAAQLGKQEDMSATSKYSPENSISSRDSSDVSLNYLFLDDNEDVAAEEVSNGHLASFRELIDIKHSLRKKIVSKILVCAGFDSSLFDQLKAKRDELREGDVSRAEAREQMHALREQVRQQFDEHKDELKSCHEELNLKESEEFLALQKIRSECYPRSDQSETGDAADKADKKEETFDEDKEKSDQELSLHQEQHHDDRGSRAPGFFPTVFRSLVESDQCKEAVAAAKVLIE
ncbi:MAG: hypothetical protein R3B45_09830 [Bdellovibrionota bacterium]